MSNTFQIEVKPWSELKYYKMNVELYYYSVQVLRFRVSGGKKYLCMEKNLLKKTRQWKIIDKNFEFSSEDKINALTIQQIRDAIEEKIGGKSGSDIML